MNRRELLSTLSLSYVSFLVACQTKGAVSSFVQGTATPNAVDAMIDARIARVMTPEDYTNLEGIPCASRQSIKLALKNPALMQILNQYRIQGLTKLKAADLEPKLKLLLLNLHLEDAMHEVATCLDHFLGVHGILKSWGHPDEVAHVGLIHAIYGTEMNQIRLVDCQSASARRDIRNAVGTKTEEWTYGYATMCTEDVVWQSFNTKAPAASYYDLSTKTKTDLAPADAIVLAEVLVANSYEPYIALGDKSILSRLKQFEVMEGFLSKGALAAIALYKTSSGDNSPATATRPSSCEYFVPPVPTGVDLSMCQGDGA